MIAKPIPYKNIPTPSAAHYMQHSHKRDLHALQTVSRAKDQDLDQPHKKPHPRLHSPKQHSIKIAPLAAGQSTVHVSKLKP